jgi:hypothetical protein
MVNTKVADAGSSRDYSKGNKLLRVDFKARFVELRSEEVLRERKRDLASLDALPLAFGRVF